VLVNQRRALLVAGALLAGAVVVGALLLIPATEPWMQAVDDAAWRLAGRVQNRPATLVAEALSLVGSVWVNWPLRIAAALLLLWRRRLHQLVAFALAVAVSELLISVLKGVYDRPRPLGSMIGTTAASFPSGHAIAGAVTAVGLVLVLLPPGRSRWRWEVWAVTFSFVMALSRVYLRAHWLTDTVAGGLLGAGLALGWPAALTPLLYRRHPHLHPRHPGARPRDPDESDAS
jgi:undecaprenyl-diphosphatase